MSKVLEMWRGMTGTVLPYALGTAPSGWLICDGSALASGTADVLRDKLIADGSPYGDDGGGNPKLPDLRGEFMRGLDGGRGVDTGRTLGSWQDEEFKAHSHTEKNTATSTEVSAGSGATVLSTQNTDQSGTTGGDETRPRNIALNFIIKT